MKILFVLILFISILIPFNSVQADDFLVINGKEYTNDIQHALNFDGFPKLILAHPDYRWTAYNNSQIINLSDEYIGIEVANPYNDNIILMKERWDIINIERIKQDKKLLWGFGVDDSHTANDTGQYWIMVKSDNLSIESIFISIEYGNFYYGNLVITENMTPTIISNEYFKRYEFELDNKWASTQPFTGNFSLEGKWYKGNLHTHTKNSDGLLSKNEMINLYKSLGYDFIAITDHDSYPSVKSPNPPEQPPVYYPSGGSGGSFIIGNKRTTSIYSFCSANGTLWEDIEILSLDSKLSIKIPRMTALKGKDNRRIYTISVNENSNNGTKIYELKPECYFSQPVLLSIKSDNISEEYSICSNNNTLDSFSENGTIKTYITNLGNYFLMKNSINITIPETIPDVIYPIISETFLLLDSKEVSLFSWFWQLEFMR